MGRLGSARSLAPYRTTRDSRARRRVKCVECEIGRQKCPLVSRSVREGMFARHVVRSFVRSFVRVAKYNDE